MNATTFLGALLINSAMSPLLGLADGVVLSNNEVKDLASPVDFLKLTNAANGLSNMLRPTGGEKTVLDLATPGKRGGRAALVDLLDYMNKPKPKVEAFASTLAKQGAPTKSKFWDTMLYDEK